MEEVEKIKLNSVIFQIKKGVDDMDEYLQSDLFTRSIERNIEELSSLAEKEHLLVNLCSSSTIGYRSQ